MIEYEIEEIGLLVDLHILGTTTVIHGALARVRRGDTTGDTTGSVFKMVFVHSDLYLLAASSTTPQCKSKETHTAGQHK
jgi:hypothetical protein